MYLEKFIPTIPTYLHFIYLHNQQCKEKRNYFGLPIQSVFFIGGPLRLPLTYEYMFCFFSFVIAASKDLAKCAMPTMIK